MFAGGRPDASGLSNWQDINQNVSNLLDELDIPRAISAPPQLDERWAQLQGQLNGSTDSGLPIDIRLDEDYARFYRSQMANGTAKKLPPPLDGHTIYQELGRSNVVQGGNTATTLTEQLLRQHSNSSPAPPLLQDNSSAAAIERVASSGVFQALSQMSLGNSNNRCASPNPTAGTAGSTASQEATLQALVQQANAFNAAAAAAAAASAGNGPSPAPPLGPSPPLSNNAPSPQLTSSTTNAAVAAALHAAGMGNGGGGNHHHHHPPPQHQQHQHQQHYHNNNNQGPPPPHLSPEYQVAYQAAYQAALQQQAQQQLMMNTGHHNMPQQLAQMLNASAHLGPNQSSMLAAQLASAMNPGFLPPNSHAAAAAAAAAAASAVTQGGNGGGGGGGPRHHHMNHNTYDNGPPPPHHMDRRQRGGDGGGGNHHHHNHNNHHHNNNNNRRGGNSNHGGQTYNGGGNRRMMHDDHQQQQQQPRVRGGLFRVSDEDDAAFPCKYNTLDEVQGKVVETAQDQNGCRFLQKKFDEGGPAAISLVFQEMIDQIVDLMTDPFGNYLIQKLLDRCSEEQRLQIIKAVSENGELVNAALNTHGTRAVQKLIETLTSREQISLVVEALKPGIVTMIRDLNGNHVVQRCLQRLGPEDAQFIYHAAAANCLEIATHRHGCCVLQRCIDYSNHPQRVELVRHIAVHSLQLSQDPFGNYVVQYVLELGHPELSTMVMQNLKGSFAELSTQKFSSNVVEKCLKLGGSGLDEEREKVVTELMNSPALARLLQDPYANYVMQSSLSVTTGQLHGELVEAMRPHLPALRGTPHGKRIIAKMAVKV